MAKHRSDAMIHLLHVQVQDTSLLGTVPAESQGKMQIRVERDSSLLRRAPILAPYRAGMP